MKTWNRISRESFGLLFFITFVTVVHGQQRVNTYAHTPFTATWTDISTTGTPMSQDSFVINSFGHDYDFAAAYAQLTLPFDFTYDGVVIPAGDTIHIMSSNGAISLGPTVPTDANDYSYLGSSSYPGFVCPFSTPLLSDTTAILGNAIVTEVDGTAPNQVLTIEFVDIWPTDEIFHDPNYTGGAGTNIQVKFYETTGNIEFIYQDHNFDFGSTFDTSDCGIGLNGFSTPSFVSNVYATGTIRTPATDIRWTQFPPSQLSLEPKSLDFGTLLSGEADTLCVTAQSLGPATLKILGFGFLGD